MNRNIAAVGALLVVGVASCIIWSQNMAGEARLASPPDQSKPPLSAINAYETELV